MSSSRLLDTLAWWTLGGVVLYAAAFFPLGCGVSPVVSSPDGSREHDALQRVDAGMKTSPVVHAPAPVEDVATLEKRKPMFRSMSVRDDVTDLVIADEMLFAGSSGGVEAWTLGGEHVA